MSEFKNTTTTNINTLYPRLKDDANDKLTRRLTKELDLYKIDFEYDIIAKCVKSKNDLTLRETYPSFIIKKNTIIKVNKIHSNMDELVSNQLENPELQSHIYEHMLKLTKPSVNIFEKTLKECLLNTNNLNQVLIFKFVNVDNKIDINQICIYIFLLFGIIITYKIIKYFKDLDVNFKKFEFKKNTD
jgi:hypothetical protein